MNGGVVIPHPKNWDPALDSLLNTPLSTSVYKRKYDWNQSTVETYETAPTFIAAINISGKRKMPPPKNHPAINTAYAEHVQKMILKPLSPRKPTVIPGSQTSLMKFRDRYAIESILQQRNRRTMLSRLPPFSVSPEYTGTQHCPVRTFDIPNRDAQQQQGFIHVRVD